MEKTELDALIQRAETLDLDDEARKDAPSGSFIDLPCGNTHYQIDGKARLWF